MRIARNATAAVGQVVASALIMFALYRAILETVGAERLGIWSVVLATVSASRIGDLGLSASVTRFVAKYRAQGDDLAAGHAVQTALLSLVVLLASVWLPAHALLGGLFGRLFGPEALGEALALLPYALFSFVLTAAAGVIQSGLDGCQRYDSRAALMIFGQLLYLSAALWLMPSYGLVGLAWAQIGQGVGLVAAGWLLLRRLLPMLPWAPCEWRGNAFREMLSYGLQFQLGTVAMMLCEPLTKALLGTYGGLATAGYYEMARQFISKAWGLIVSANQVLVPAAADLNDRDPHRLIAIYRTNLRLLFFVVPPFYALLAAWAPLLSELWIGRYDPTFVLFVSVLALARSINTFAGPAYFANLGTGRVLWNTAAQVWMGLANAGLGLALGPRYGATGIICGMAVAVITASALVVAGFHRERHLSWRILLPGEAAWLVFSGCVLVITGHYLYRAALGEPAALRFLLCALLPLPLVGPALWRHPLRPMLQARIHGILGKGLVA